MVPGQTGVSRSYLLPATVIFIYVVSLALPPYFDIGGLRLSSYRIVLILTLLPTFLMVIAGIRGSWRLPDFLILGYATWASISLFAAHGFDDAWQPAGILAIETIGSYFLARALIFDPRSFRTFARIFVIEVLFLAPFALYEAYTGISELHDLFGYAFNVYFHEDVGMRMGLHRAYVTFEHPILFGVFTSVAFGLSLFAFDRHKQVFWKLVRSAGILVAVFCSLSAGAFLSVLTQLVFAAWRRLTESTSYPWSTLCVIAMAVYAGIDVLSNRTPIEVIISYMTFQQDASYNRVLIWHFGTDEVLRHPFLGIGLADWVRPRWMGDSVDNFWLLRAMRHGLPAFFMLLTIFLYICTKLAKLKTRDVDTDLCRKALFVSFVGLAVSIVTVDLWNASHSFLFFLFGSSMWLTGPKSDETAPRSSSDEIAQAVESDRASPILENRRPSSFAGAPQRTAEESGSSKPQEHRRTNPSNGPSSKRGAPRIG